MGNGGAIEENGLALAGGGGRNATAGGDADLEAFDGIKQGEVEKILPRSGGDGADERGLVVGEFGWRSEAEPAPGAGGRAHIEIEAAVGHAGGIGHGELFTTEAPAGMQGSGIGDEADSDA